MSKLGVQHVLDVSLQQSSRFTSAFCQHQIKVTSRTGLVLIHALDHSRDRFSGLIFHSNTIMPNGTVKIHRKAEVHWPHFGQGGSANKAVALVAETLGSQSALTCPCLGVDEVKSQECCLKRSSRGSK